MAFKSSNNKMKCKFHCTLSKTRAKYHSWFQSIKNQYTIFSLSLWILLVILSLSSQIGNVSQYILICLFAPWSGFAFLIPSGALFQTLPASLVKLWLITFVFPPSIISLLVPGLVSFLFSDSPLCGFLMTIGYSSSLEFNFHISVSLICAAI